MSKVTAAKILDKMINSMKDSKYHNGHLLFLYYFISALTERIDLSSSRTIRNAIWTFVVLFAISSLSCSKKIICKQEFFPEGSLSHIVCKDEKGRKQGAYIEFYTTGDTAFVIHYTNDSINGHVKSFYKNGTIRYRALYSMNRIMEMLEFYDMFGNQLNTGELKNGNGFLRIYDGKGHIQLEGPIVNGFMDGTWKIFGRTEKIFYTKEFESGIDKSTHRRRLIF